MSPAARTPRVSVMSLLPNSEGFGTLCEAKHGVASFAAPYSFSA